MATPYQEIYEYFLNRISDYSFVNLTQEDLENSLESYLKMAISSFYLCKNDLSNRDDVNKQFNADLTDLEKNILALYMVYEYLRPKIVTTDLLCLQLSDRDSRAYSQANHLKELKDLHTSIKQEVEHLVRRYSFIGVKAGDLKK